MGGSATGTLGANNEATWCDIFPNVPPPVALAACGFGFVLTMFSRVSWCCYE